MWVVLLSCAKYWYAYHCNTHARDAHVDINDIIITITISNDIILYNISSIMHVCVGINRRLDLDKPAELDLQPIATL